MWRLLSKWKCYQEEEEIVFLIKIHLKFRPLAAKLSLLQDKLATSSCSNQHLEHISFPVNQSGPDVLRHQYHSLLGRLVHSYIQNLSFEDFLSSRRPPIRIPSAGKSSTRQQLPPLQSANECARLHDCDWVRVRAEAVAALACRKDVKSVIMPTDNKWFSMCEHVESVSGFLSVCCGSVSSLCQMLCKEHRCNVNLLKISMNSSHSALPPLSYFNQYLLHSHSLSALSAVRHRSPTSRASYLACWLSKADIWIHYCVVQYIPSLCLSAPLSFTTCLFARSVFSCFHGWHNC